MSYILTANREISERMNEAIHYWFSAVEYSYREEADCYTVTLPHLVGFKPDPNDEETKTVEYQQAEVEDNVQAVMRRSGLSGLSYTIRPTGTTEGPQYPCWFRFEAIIRIPK